jgi:hypothetical protein
VHTTNLKFVRSIAQTRTIKTHLHLNQSNKPLVKILVGVKHTQRLQSFLQCAGQPLILPHKQTNAHTSAQVRSTSHRQVCWLTSGAGFAVLRGCVMPKVGGFPLAPLICTHALCSTCVRTGEQHTRTSTRTSTPTNERRARENPLAAWMSHSTTACSCACLCHR